MFLLPARLKIDYKPCEFKKQKHQKYNFEGLKLTTTLLSFQLQFEHSCLLNSELSGLSGEVLVLEKEKHFSQYILAEFISLDRQRAQASFFLSQATMHCLWKTWPHSSSRDIPF